MELAADLNDPEFMMEALFVLGGTCSIAAISPNAQDELDESGSTTTTASARNSGPSYTGHDAAVSRPLLTCRMILWHLGYPDRAEQMSREML